jgi:hypothetical protein
VAPLFSNVVTLLVYRFEDLFYSSVGFTKVFVLCLSYKALFIYSKSNLFVGWKTLFTVSNYRITSIFFLLFSFKLSRLIKSLGLISVLLCLSRLKFLDAFFLPVICLSCIKLACNKLLGSCYSLSDFHATFIGERITCFTDSFKLFKPLVFKSTVTLRFFG